MESLIVTAPCVRISAFVYVFVCVLMYMCIVMMFSLSCSQQSSLSSRKQTHTDTHTLTKQPERKRWRQCHCRFCHPFDVRMSSLFKNRHCSRCFTFWHIHTHSHTSRAYHCEKGNGQTKAKEKFVCISCSNMNNVLLQQE